MRGGLPDLWVVVWGMFVDDDVGSAVGDPLFVGGRGTGDDMGTRGRSELDDRRAYGPAGRADHDRLPRSQPRLTDEA